MNKNPITLLAMAVALSCATVHATDYQPGEFGSLPILLGTESVAKELGLTKSQSAGIAAARSAFRTEARQLVQAAGSRGSHSDFARLERLTEKYNNRVRNLLRPEQRDKIIDIERSLLGGTLLYSPAIQKELGITPAQRSQIRQIEEQAFNEMVRANKAFDQGKLSHHERLRTLRTARIAHSKELLGLLTPEQVDHFNQL